MNAPSACPTAPTPAPASGFWRRRLEAVVIAPLKQGTTPDALTASIAASAVCSILPFIGLTSLLNLGVGMYWRLNHPIMQTLNQLLTPVQLALIVVYVRLGETVWSAPPVPISPAAIVASFREESLAVFLQSFGWAGVHAFTAWILSAPAVFALVYLPARPALRRLGRRIGSGAKALER